MNESVAPGFSVVHGGDLEALVGRAKAEPLLRDRICLHASHGDSIQEMVVALVRGSYIPPHRHVGRSESLHVMAGEGRVCFFDDEGSCVEHLDLGGEQGVWLYRLQDDRWHTVVALTEFFVFHEVVGGPFVPGGGNLAPWAPPQEEAATGQACVERWSGALHGA